PPLQRGGAAGSLVPEGAELHPRPLRRVPRRQRGHVAGALHHHRDEPPPRLPAVLLGHVPRHEVGLGHVRRNTRPLLHALLSLHPPGAPLFEERRDQGGKRRGGAQEWREPESPLKRGPSPHPRPNPYPYGVIAEFASPDELIHAVKETRAAGYEIIEAYTPYPI